MTRNNLPVKLVYCLFEFDYILWRHLKVSYEWPPVASFALELTIRISQGLYHKEWINSLKCQESHLMGRWTGQFLIGGIHEGPSSLQLTSRYELTGNSERNRSQSTYPINRDDFI